MFLAPEKWRKIARVLLRVLAVLLTFYFVLNWVAWIVFTRTIGIELFLLTVLSVGSAGLIFEKEWGRKTVVAGAVAAFIFNLVDVFFLSRNLDSASINVGFLTLLLAAFYGVVWPRMLVGVRRRVQRQILVVDDDRGFLRLLEAGLTKRGVSVLTAETGEKGLALAGRYRPDLIFLDVILPGIKGRSVCARIKEDHTTKDIPVVFLTAKNSPDDVEAELAAGAVSHLTKPVSLDDLFAEINKVLGAA